MLDAIREHGKLEVGLPPGPPFFRFSDPGECRRTLEQIGFSRVRSVEAPQTWRFPSVAAWFEGVERSTVRTAALLRAQTPEAYAAIRRAFEERGRAWQNGSEKVDVPMPAVLTTATRP